MRGVPDVAADADSTTAMSLLFTGGVPLPAQGTSAATPLWAAVIALADQTPATTSASPTPPSTPSPAAPPATAPSTT